MNLEENFTEDEIEAYVCPELATENTNDCGERW